MEYPKKIMKLSELKNEMGFPESQLRRIARQYKGVAWKKNPTLRNSTLVFDTGELEKIRKNECVKL